MVKVLHVCMGTMVRGGMESYVMNLYRAIDKTRCQFGFLVTCDQKRFDDKIASAYDAEILRMGGEIYEVGVDMGKSYISRNLKKGAALYKLLKKLRTLGGYSVVHIHTDSPAKVPELIISWLTGYKVRIVHSHNSTGKLNRSVPGWRLTYRVFSTHRFACSTNSGKWVFGEQYTNMHNIRTAPNAIDVDQFSFHEDQRDIIRKMLKIDDHVVLGHVGRFSTEKNHVFLLKVFKSFLNRKPDTVLLLVGGGALEQAAKELADTMQISGQVRFLGVRDDVAPLMMAMDCFVMPSLYEGLPVTLIEAQATGLPVVAADTITGETKLTDTFEFMSLDASAGQWADAIMKTLKKSVCIGRSAGSTAVKKAGYDIHDSLEYFYRIYRCE